MIRSRDLDQGRFSFSTKQSVILLLLYFVGYIVGLAIFVRVFSYLIFGLVGEVHPSLMMSGVLFLLISSLYVVREPLISSFNFFKRNLLVNLKSVLTNFAYLWLFTMASNVIFYFLLGERSAENQLMVEQGIMDSPLVYGVLVMFFAPIVEELVFRGVLYQKFRSKQSFGKAIVISTLIFGSIHVLPAFMLSFDFSELLFIVQYMGLSFFMIRCFEETSSIWGSISVHFLNNALGFILILMAF